MQAPGRSRDSARPTEALLAGPVRFPHVRLRGLPVLATADVRQHGPAAARRHAGGVEHLPRLLPSRPAGRLRLRPRAARAARGSLARGSSPWAIADALLA